MWETDLAASRYSGRACRIRVLSLLLLGFCCTTPASPPSTKLRFDHPADNLTTMSLRVRPKLPTGFIEPCLPSPADKPPSGSNWIHEIKHDGYRLMARRDPVAIRLLTRQGNDWSDRFPLIVEAVNHLKVRSA